MIVGLRASATGVALAISHAYAPAGRWPKLALSGRLSASWRKALIDRLSALDRFAGIRDAANNAYPRGVCRWRGLEEIAT